MTLRFVLYTIHELVITEKGNSYTINLQKIKII